MSIPLDRLYRHLEGVCGDDILIYRWFPHGSKKIEDLVGIKEYFKENTTETAELNLTLSMVCNDQEPLNFDQYSLSERQAVYQAQCMKHKWGATQHFQNLIQEMPVLRAKLINPFTVYDKIILCHSEKNSIELSKFEDAGFIGAYYWSHAIIARDWFRYAEHDRKLKSTNNFKYDFLIYNRAWAGTREYRLKFCEMLVNTELVHHCKTSFAPFDTDVKYTNHVFQNKNFELTNLNLEDYFVENTTTSCYSADYDANDYTECGLEVVLETLFDDQRNHLTEKALRPIACNKPFILASTPHSLQYLRSYGFKTFDSLIDETYDTIIDPTQRLKAIVQELKRISCLSNNDKQELWQKLNEITEYNQQLFFSTQWHDKILDELKTNLNQAIVQANNHKTGKYLRKLYSHPDLNTEEPSLTRKILDEWLVCNGLSY